MKIDGESHETICKWLADTCDVHITPKSLFNVFRQSIPDILLRHNKIVMFEPEEMDTKHIEKLEKLAEFQFDRIKAQYYDELEHMGEPKVNEETGEIDYAGVNKNLNETINTYNRLVKNIYELKMSIGLIRKMPEEKTVSHQFKMSSSQRDAMRRMVHSQLANSGRLEKFRQTPTDQITEAEYTTPKMLPDVEDTTEETPEVIDVSSTDEKVG